MTIARSAGDNDGWGWGWALLQLLQWPPH